jgi:hypothetical protein
VSRASRPAKQDRETDNPFRRSSIVQAALETEGDVFVSIFLMLRSLVFGGKNMGCLNRRKFVLDSGLPHHPSIGTGKTFICTSEDPLILSSRHLVEG